MKLKYILFGLAFLFFLFSLVSYLKKSKISHSSKDVLPTMIQFPKTFFDVGVQKLRVPVKVGYWLYNTGKNNLFIEKVVPDCHCTVAKFASGPILPKDSSIIELKYDASNPGPFQSSAMVTTNSDSSPTLLIFRGVVE